MLCSGIAELCRLALASGTADRRMAEGAGDTAGPPAASWSPAETDSGDGKSGGRRPRRGCLLREPIGLTMPQRLHGG